MDAIDEYLENVLPAVKDKTAEIMEQQDLRYVAKDANYKPKTKAQWLKHWEVSGKDASRFNTALRNIAIKRKLEPSPENLRDLENALSDNPSKAALKRLGINAKGIAKGIDLNSLAIPTILSSPLVGGDQGYAAGMFKKTGDKKYLKDLGIATGRDFLTGAGMSGVGHVGSKLTQTGVGKLAIKQAGKGLLKQSLLRGGLGIGGRAALGAAVPVLGWGLLAYGAYDTANQFTKAYTGKSINERVVSSVSNLFINRDEEQEVNINPLLMQRPKELALYR
jgi:hypothetical protein